MRLVSTPLSSCGPHGALASDGLIVNLRVAFSVAAKGDPFVFCSQPKNRSGDRWSSSTDQSHHHRDHEQDNRDIKNELRDLDRESSDPAEAEDGRYQRDDQEG